MQLFKRAMSLILAVILLLGNVPAVYAAEGETIPETEAVETEAIETTATVIPEETEAPETEAPVEETTVVTEETQPVTEPVEETTPAETVVETVPQETVPEETVEETVPAETEGEFVLTGLPEGYELGVLDAYHRRNILEADAVAQLKAQIPGEDYVADEILVFAENEEEATLFAAAFGGELRSFSGKLVVIGLTEMTVVEAVEASVSEEILLPAASANHVAVKVEKAPHVEPESSEDTMSVFSDDAPVEKDWNYWINVVGIDDEYLQDPSDPEYNWWHDMLDTYAAWGVTMGDPGMEAALITGSEMITASYYQDSEGKYVVESVPGPNSGHPGYNTGNSIIETMVGTVGNGAAGAGVAPNCYVNVYYTYGAWPNDDVTAAGIAECILDAADNEDNRVILVDDILYDYNAALDAAVQYAIEEKNKPVIANVGDLYGNALTYPAAIDGVIGVACVDREGGRYIESNYGPHVDISAPAWDLNEAAGIVTGAALLYLSVYPETTPARLEKVLEAACTKISDPGMGAGVLNLAKLFGGKPTAPEYIVADGIGLQELDPKGTIPCESFIVFRPSEGDADDNGILLVTDNGKAPAVKDGKIVSGFTAMGSGSYFLDLSDYAGKTVTLKAAWVSGTGIMGKVTTVKLKVAKSSNIARVELSGSGVTAESGYFSVAALSGKSYTYTATLIPKTYTTLDGETITAEVTDQRVTWTIENKSADLTAAKVDKNGKLTLPKAKTGTLILCAASVADPDVKAYLQVTVENLDPVKTVVLNDIVYDEASDFGYISVKQLLDAKGNDLSAYLMVFDVQWTSSNTKVAEIRPIDGMPGYAEIIRKGPGKVKFTATVLDGGNAKATSASFTMKQRVESVSFTGGVEYGASYYYLSQPGKTVAPKVSVLPKNATDKSLTYTITASTAPGITVNPKTGKVTVGKTVSYGNGAKIVAMANDGSGVQGVFVVMVYPKAHTLKVGLTLDPWEEDDYRPTYDKNGNLTGLTLFTITPAGSSVDMTEIIVDAEACYQINVTDVYMPAIASNSAPGVIGVTQNDGAFYLTALKSGTAKLTFKSPEGAKKHTVTVKVVTPPSSITVCSSMPTVEEDSRYTYMAVGASATNTVRFGDAYGKVTNSKVTWSGNLKIDCWGSPEDNAEASNYYYDVQKLITFKNGKLTTKKALGTYVEKLEKLDARIEYTVIATMDGARGELTYIIAPATTTIYPEKKTYTIDTGNYDNENPLEIMILTDSGSWMPTVTSSNPAAAGAESYFSNGQDPETGLPRLSYQVWIPKPVKKATNVTLTFKVPDGTNKSCKVTLKLMPAFAIQHTLPEWLGMHYLSSGCYTTLKAAFGTTAAKADWTVTTLIEATDSAAKTYADGFAAQIAQAVSVTSAGKVSVDKSLTDVLKGFEEKHFDKIKVYADITATTKDGMSSATATYRITAPVEKLYSRDYTGYDSSVYKNYTVKCNISLGSHVNSMLMVTSSHPDLVSWDDDTQPEIKLFSDGSCVLYAPLRIREAVEKNTKVTLTIKTIDGTNKTFKFYMTLVP